MTQALITLATTVFLLLGSPGPAPMALAAVGATCGIRQAASFYFGLLSGLGLSVIGAAAGLAALFAAWPNLASVFRIIGGIYILYVAYKIATAPVALGDDGSSGVPSFADGVLLNVLNPKSYAVFLAIFSRNLLPTDHAFSAYAATGGVCVAIAAITNAAWLGLGGLIKPVFQRPRAARIVRIVFAVAMVLAVAWAFLQ